MLERLDASTAEQRRFVSDASHELRSPVSGVRTALEVALAAQPSGDHRRLLERLLLENHRLESLLDQLLVLARTDEPGAITSLGPVDLSSLVLDEIHRPARRGVTVTSDVAGGITVDGDADLLTRVIRNLVSNSVRHATSKVVVRLTDDADAVRLVVTDDGPGVPPADWDRIFGRFVRLDDDRGRSTGGAGLGLAIARDAVAAHGGTIAVADAAPGASFIVVLPRHNTERRPPAVTSRRSA
jgi:signal transduction histidine kinase